MLQQACVVGDMEEVQCLLKEHISTINISDERGKTALHKAATRGFEDICKLLVDAGAIVDACDERGQTPLFLASWKGHVEVVHLLLSLKADVLIKDKSLRTHLHIASSKSGNEDIIKSLVRSGCRINARDARGNTPLTLAATTPRQNVWHLLVDLGANPTVKNTMGITAKEISLANQPEMLKIWDMLETKYEALTTIRLSKQPSLKLKRAMSDKSDKARKLPIKSEDSSKPSTLTYLAEASPEATKLPLISSSLTSLLASVSTAESKHVAIVNVSTVDKIDDVSDMIVRPDEEKLAHVGRDAILEDKGMEKGKDDLKYHEVHKIDSLMPLDVPSTRSTASVETSAKIKKSNLITDRMLRNL